ncbi:MAG: hypothetical protein U0527_04135 [Candidatus Eisenbacteria bacterium]
MVQASNSAGEGSSIAPRGEGAMEPPRATAPESEKAARMAELEIQAGNQRDRLQTVRKTQEFLYHDRESGLSYYLVDGTLVQGSYRGGEVKRKGTALDHPSADAMRERRSTPDDDRTHLG